MSKTRNKPSASDVREMRPEYRFDYTHARPNRFAARMGKETVTVVLDPDVAAVFKTADAVNDLLRSVIAALPPKARMGGVSKPRKAG
jgi:hypothetical protein